MDDECTEELGRPISGMKVAELRDELSKRNLIKTGNKKELVDRLRLALKRESSSSSSQCGPADLTIQTAQPTPSLDPSQIESDQSHAEIVIDYSSPDKQSIVTEHSSTLQNQQAAPVESAADVVDYSSPDRKTPPTQLANTLDIETQELPKEAEQPNSQTSGAEETIQVEQESVDEIHLLQSSADKIQEQAIKPDDQNGPKLDLSNKSNQEVDNIQGSITIKRRVSDLKDSPSVNKGEKRRKWCDKSEQNQNNDSSQATALSGGISSQKLQELIDLKQAELAATNSKETSNSNNSENEALKKTPSDPARVANESNYSSCDEKLKDGQSKESGITKQNRQEITSSKTDTELKETNQSEREPTNGLLVENLVRPFTILQLKEVLTKHGPHLEDKFWTDKIKSKCCVLYDSKKIAQQIKESLDGQHWPSSNPKTLEISYITEEEYIKHINSDVSKPAEVAENPVNGGDEPTQKSMSNRLGERVDDGESGPTGPARKRLGEKLTDGEVSTKSSHIDRGDNSQPQELDDLFKKTKSKPQLFWLPVTEEQAEINRKRRAEREARAQNQPRKQVAPRRSASPKRRPQGRRGSPRHRSPARRSPIRHRSPPRRRSPPRDSPAQRRRSPGQSRRSPGPQRRSPAYSRRSPGPGRRSPGPMRRSPMGGRLSPGLPRRSPGPTRRSPGLMRRSPGPIRRSPGPIRRSPGPIRRSPGPIRRSPGPIRRSPVPMRRSPGPIRRSPGQTRRSPGPIRRSPGTLRQSPVARYRSPGPIRRSPPPMRRSPGPIRRSPGIMCRSPMLPRRSPAPVRGRSPLSRSRSTSRSPVRRRSPIRRRPSPRYLPQDDREEYPSEPRRIQRPDRLR